ncbi:acyl-CoA thioesterase II [Nocardia stercoris]|uniref:Acyl-CoA thioesterase II n=1 Tax=Nocardia stercoris TaxID=2483361 RepID=A0A3M2L0C9_9NOCA|nr:acyl-CoA thioesterase II [Nocardia stercoris]
MHEPAEDLRVLLGLLDLEPAGPGTFLGHHPEKVWSRTFGGQLIAQSIMAAGRSIAHPVPIHAINAHFVRGGDPAQPIEYRVQIMREAKSFANCMVTAVQNDEELVVSLVSFLKSAKGLEHAPDAPQVPGPEGLPTLQDVLAGYEDKLEMFVKAPHPVDMRYANDPAWILKERGEALDHNRVWLRAQGPMPEDSLLHTALLAYSSDTAVLDPIITRHGLSWGFDRIVAVTVNHSIWFHRPVRFDDWVLWATESPVAAATRGLGTGHFYSSSGEMLATVVQEGLVRHFPTRG